VGQPGAALVEVLVAAGLSSSKGQARRDIEAGGVYVNNQREADVTLVIGSKPNHLLFGKFVLLRKGKRNYALVRFEG
jgi:tyrosyl-tRNA synthetase